MIRPRKQPDICQGTCSLTFRQYSTEDTDFSSVISIHAPAEGATVSDCLESAIFQISIHAPAEGATNTVGGVMADYKLFQSTLPWRERRDYLQGNPRGYNISIHAPAEGATRNPDAVFLRLTYFNPRSRGGNDESNLQSSFVLNYFNPRSRGGSDIAVRFTCTSTSGFQSTLPRRERQIDHAERQYIERFQSTLPRRERRQLVAGRAVGGHISIHAPAEGATCETGIETQRSFTFQSTLPRRERHRLLLRKWN